MDESTATAIWLALAGYCALGALVLAWLTAGGMARLDRQAAAAPLQVKVMLAPGLIALWPLVLWRMAGVKPPEDRG
jgi:hypothetical protein